MSKVIDFRETLANKTVKQEELEYHNEILQGLLLKRDHIQRDIELTQEIIKIIEDESIIHTSEMLDMIKEFNADGDK